MKYNKNEVTGKMRDRIILQNVTRVRSLSGFASESWVDIATIWAFAESKLPGSNETIIDGKNTAKNVCDFTIRYISTITEESRIVWGEKLYQVKNLKVSHDRRFISFTGVFYDSYIIRDRALLANIIATSSLFAQINIFKSVSANLQANAFLSAELSRITLASAALSGGATLSAEALITKFAASSLNTASSLAASALVSKLAASSLTGAGTLAAALTVTGGSAFDADAQAFFNRVTTAGGTLSATEQNAVNTLVIALKADGIWTKMKAIYPMVGASAAACAQNLKSSSFTGTFTAGWTFASTGAKPNGTSAFMDTNLPNNTMSQNSLTICTYLRTNFTQATSICDIACWNSGFGSSIYPRGINNNVLINNNSTTQINLGIGSNSNSTGFYVNKRTSSTEVVFQKNSTQTTVANNSNNLITTNYIVSRAGNFNGEYSPRETALVGIGDGLTDTEAANFYTDVQAFQTTLSRQV
jgi:SPP1 family predicted phage head-tail adaptor